MRYRGGKHRLRIRSSSRRKIRIVASKAFAEAVFGKHPYGRPVEGTEKSLDRITGKTFAAFHKEYYLPDNTIMTVVGDISKDELKSLLDRYS